MALTPKQQRFVEEYLVDLNATQAAIRAGYSARTAAVQASRLLTNVNICFAVKAGQAKRADAAEISQSWVVKKLRKNAELAHSIEQPGPANRSYELIGKHIGMWPNRPEDNNNTVNLVRIERVVINGESPTDTDAPSLRTVTIAE